VRRRSAPSWPGITVRWHGQFASVAGQLPDATTLPLMRLRYNDSASHWGFAVYRASHDDYDQSVLPTGYPFGTRKTPSTVPAASTSTPPHGSPRHPRRINGGDQ
jgi:hypothetical protein